MLENKLHFRGNCQGLQKTVNGVVFSVTTQLREHPWTELDWLRGHVRCAAAMTEPVILSTIQTAVLSLSRLLPSFGL